MPIHAHNTAHPRAAQPRALKLGTTACLCMAFTVSAHANINPKAADTTPESPDIAAVLNTADVQLEAGLQGFPRPTAAITLPNRQAAEAAARRLAGRNTQTVMRSLGWHADTVIAHYNGAPITVRRALSDEAIFRLPPIQFIGAFRACLTRYGFTRTPMNTRDIEQANNLPRGMLNAISMVESRHYNCAVSAGGAMGRYQFQDVTVRGLNLSDPFNAAETAQVAAHHLADHMRRGSLEIALAAYNCGIGCVAENKARHGSFRIEYLPPHTQGYVRSISAAIQSSTTPPPAPQRRRPAVPSRRALHMS